ncbi:MAG: heme ABC exporter ATP-binding protein CcmA [Salaquimonas sp.]
MKFEANTIAVDRGDRRIVQEVSFSLTNGEVLVVTGENGSGKSTLLRALAGLLPLAEGRLHFDFLAEGADDPMMIRENIHYLGHQNAMKPSLSVRENLNFWQDFTTKPQQAVSVEGMSTEEALDFVDLPQTIDLPFGYLSTGMKRRVSIAKLLIREKPIWIVDEPTAGLDANSSEMFSGLARDHCANGGILIAATHLPLGIENAKTLHIKRLEGQGVDDFFDAEADSSGKAGGE